jgi:predicted permease
MGTLVQDVRFAIRMLTKNPGFTAVVVLTLALGIGANTALFSIVNGVLLNPLPYPHPEQLVTLHESKPNFANGSISYPNFRDWQKDNHTFSAIAVTRSYGYSLTGMGEAEQVRAGFVSSDFFPLLGVRPVIGRAFAPDEDRIGAAPTVLISAGFWKRKFGSAPDVLGKSLTLDGMDYTIVGVIPANFDLLLKSFRTAELYVPIGQWTNNLLTSRGAGLGIHGVGRLKPGVTIEQARADMNQVAQNLAVAYPDSDKGIGASLIPIQSDMVGDVRPTLLILLGAVGFVLLIACVNVASLLLARSTGRTREFAIRAALGAGQGRLVRQLLTESILLALAGGGLGLLVADWSTRAALGALPVTLPRAGEIGLDTHVLIFAVAISLLAGILFGLAPALKTSQAKLHDTLKETGRGSSGAHYRVQGAFVVVEMAMALVLLVGAGLMIRSLTRLWSVNPGFDPHNVLTFGLTLPPSLLSASPQAIRATDRALDDQFEATPGIQAASLVWAALPIRIDDELQFWLDGQPQPSSENDMDWALLYMVDPHYLRVMGIPLERGRFFTPQDDERAPLVAVIDDVLARKFFPNQDPIGRRIHINGEDGKVEIVGIVGHVKQWGLDRDDTQPLRAQIYRPCMQMPDAFVKLTATGMNIVVRAKEGTPALFDLIRRSSNQMNSKQTVYAALSMDQIISGSLAARRFSMTLLGTFAALALLLSSVGIYGVVAYLIGRRTQEIGIRMALGAQPGDVLRLVLGEGAKMALLGVAVGAAAAFVLTRLMANMLFGVSATDPLTFACVAMVLTLVALTACYLPARRAMRVDPVVALRHE